MKKLLKFLMKINLLIIICTSVYAQDIFITEHKIYGNKDDYSIQENYNSITIYDSKGDIVGYYEKSTNIFYTNKGIYYHKNNEFIGSENSYYNTKHRLDNNRSYDLYTNDIKEKLIKIIED